MITVKNIVLRITLFYLLTVVLGIAIILKVVHLQFFTDYKKDAERFALRTESIDAGRGNIFAHDMRLLAVSIPKYDLHIDFYTTKTNLLNNKNSKLSFYYKKAGIKPASRKKISEAQKKEDIAKANNVIDEEIRKLSVALSELFKDKSAKQYEDFFTKSSKNSTEKSHRYEKLGNRHIDFIELQKLRQFPIFEQGRNKSGLIIEEKTYRNYTYGSLAATTIGYVNSNDTTTQGVERSFNRYLKGKSGSQVVMRTYTNQWMPINSQENIMPEVGYDVVTTLNVEIQETAEKALRQQIEKGNNAGIQIEGGTAIVMEVATGEIRAIANMKRNSNGTYDESYNYALTETSPPGSTFKLASLIALLDEKHVDLNTMVETQAVWEYKKNGKTLHTFREAGGHNYGNISVKKVFEKSSNVGFAKLVLQHYENNPQRFLNKLHSMGLFHESLNLQISGESKPHITETKDKIWQPQLLPLTSIGYQVTLAPIHTLVFYNAVANNGKMMKPKFVKEIMRYGEVIQSFPDEVIKDKICSDETLSKVQDALEGVVDSGTAVRFRDSRFTFAGKTGTAQRVVRGKFRHNIDGYLYHSYQATFAGYIPAKNPKYTIVVVMYSPLIRGEFFGGTYGLPVFKEIADKLYSTDFNWNKPIEREKNYASLPNAKRTEAKQFSTITSKLDIPSNNSAKSGDWVNISKEDSKLKITKVEIDENKVPSVVNMGLRDALYLLEKVGLKVTFSGKGRIRNQSITAGTPIVKGASIHLELEV